MARLSPNVVSRVGIENHVYLWGLGEATVYYMSTEAENVLESHQPGDPIDSHISGYRAFYWPGELPLKYQQQFPTFAQSVNQGLFMESNGVAIYLLPVSFEQDALTPPTYMLFISCRMFPHLTQASRASARY